jgi:plastocyanin
MPKIKLSKPSNRPFSRIAFVVAAFVAANAGAPIFFDCPTAAQEGVGHLRGRVELKNLVEDDSRIISKEISAIYQKNATLAAAAYEPLSFVIYIEDAPAQRSPRLSEPAVKSNHSGSSPRPAANPRLVMDQKALTFVPHVLPILVGSTVEFPNSDPVYHNVFSFSQTKTFDLGRYPTGQAKAVTFNKPGLVKVYCDMHSQMNAFILVLPNPYFTLSDERGNYVIRDLPAGAYKVKAWFARLPEKTAVITIRTGETTALDFDFP